MSDEPQQYFSVNEVAEELGVSRRTVHRMISAKPSLLPGSRKMNPSAKNSPLKIPQSAIEHYKSVRDAAASK